MEKISKTFSTTKKYTVLFPELNEETKGTVSDIFHWNSNDIKTQWKDLGAFLSLVKGILSVILHIIQDFDTVSDFSVKPVMRIMLIV